MTNVSSLQATSSEWSLGITTRYIYIKLTVLNDNYDDISTTLRERKLTADSSKAILEKRGVEPIFPLRMGFNLLIRRLSLRSSSEAEGDEYNILKSEEEMGWPVSMW